MPRPPPAPAPAPAPNGVSIKGQPIWTQPQVSPEGAGSAPGIPTAEDPGTLQTPVWGQFFLSKDEEADKAAAMATDTATDTVADTVADTAPAAAAPAPSPAPDAIWIDTGAASAGVMSGFGAFGAEVDPDAEEMMKAARTRPSISTCRWCRPKARPGTGDPQEDFDADSRADAEYQEAF